MNFEQRTTFSHMPISKYNTQTLALSFDSIKKITSKFRRFNCWKYFKTATTAACAIVSFEY